MGVRRKERTTLSPHRHRTLQQAQLAGEQAPGMGDAAVAGDELLEQHGEFLALLQLALEVDVVGKRANEFDHRRRRRPRPHAALLQRAVALAFDAHDARAHLVDLLFAVVGAIVAAGDDVLALGLRPDGERQDARGIRLIGQRLHEELDRLADRQLLFLQQLLQLFGDLLAIGIRHADVGQHLVDRVATLQAEREFVAVARRRLGLGGLIGGLHLEAFQIGRGEWRRRLGIGQSDGGGRGRRWRRGRNEGRKRGKDRDFRIGAVAEHEAAQGQRDGTDGKKDRPEQGKSQAFADLRPARRRGEIRHDH